jgi:lipoate-protein ligase A
VPGRVLAFGRRDVVAPGYRRAVAAARAAGFTPIERLAGGRAAVFHEGTIAFSWAMPDPYPPDRIRARFTEVSGLLVAGLHAVGVDARVGEVPGEYCPGEFSINGGGRVKLVGIGQRLVRRAAHVGGVIVVRDAGLVRDALRPVYRELGLPWDPATAGAVADLVPGITVDGVITAVIAAVGATHRLVPGDLDPATLEAAEALRPRHLPVGAGTPVG